MSRGDHFSSDPTDWPVANTDLMFRLDGGRDTAIARMLDQRAGLYPRLVRNNGMAPFEANIFLDHWEATARETISREYDNR